jgi:hypothetical protein
MADRTLAVFAHPEFPQVFKGLIAQLVEHTYCPAVLTQGAWDQNGCECGEIVLPGDQFCPTHQREADRG